MENVYKPYFFTEADFQHCTPSCSIKDVDPILVQKLDIARVHFDKPIYLTSAYRTEDWEHKHGRPGTSSHCKGLAVDIRCMDLHDRLRLVRSLIFAGFCRIGIAETFIHVDIDSSKLACLWLYPSSESR